MAKQRNGVALLDVVMPTLSGMLFKAIFPYMGLNPKRLVKLLTRFSFRGEARAYALAPCLVS